MWSGEEPAPCGLVKTEEPAPCGLVKTEEPAPCGRVKIEEPTPCRLMKTEEPAACGLVKTTSSPVWSGEDLSTSPCEKPALCGLVKKCPTSLCNLTFCFLPSRAVYLNFAHMQILLTVSYLFLHIQAPPGEHHRKSS